MEYDYKQTRELLNRPQLSGEDILYRLGLNWEYKN